MVSKWQREWHGRLPPVRPPEVDDRGWYVLVEHVERWRPLKDLAAELGVSYARTRFLAERAAKRLVGTKGQTGGQQEA